jgi:hypothetical protein
MADKTKYLAYASREVNGRSESKVLWMDNEVAFRSEIGRLRTLGFAIDDAYEVPMYETVDGRWTEGDHKRLTLQSSYRDNPLTWSEGREFAADVALKEWHRYHPDQPLANGEKFVARVLAEQVGPEPEPKSLLEPPAEPEPAPEPPAESEQEKYQRMAREAAARRDATEPF